MSIMESVLQKYTTVSFLFDPRLCLRERNSRTEGIRISRFHPKPSAQDAKSIRFPRSLDNGPYPTLAFLNLAFRKVPSFAVS
jgi:hypothetical protein